MVVSILGCSPFWGLSFIIMTQEERWRKNYEEIVLFMDTYHRNPSKHRAEDQQMLNWMKQQRKLMNKGELKPDRLAAFKRLMAKGEKLKRVNQWTVAVEEILKSDVLRNYQQEMINRLVEAWRTHRSVMVQMPTGTGKTVLMAEVIRNYLRIEQARAEELKNRKNSRGILIVAHRRELLDQIRGTVDYFGIDMEKNRITVESIQKLSREKHRPQGLQPSLVIIDEAHHALAKTYRMLWDWWPKAKFLGLTATPCRLDNTGFTDLFQTLVQSYTIQEFIRMGWLSDFDYVTAEPENPILKQVAGLKKRGVDGDYQTKEMALVMDCEESIKNLYEAYRQFVNGKKGIVYAIDRNHAMHITAYYQKQQVNCCWIEAKTPTKERDRLVQAYRDGLIDVVVNVDILSEGADFPEVEFIQLARPTLSLSKYLQQVGRGMRIAEGKDKVVILDHVGMYQAFGLPTEDWNWQLMFEGKMAGKAGMGREHLLYVRGEGTTKELADVEMVHIKRMDEEHRGLEFFIQDGLYGITLDGRVIHKPLFQQVRKADNGYFAYCTYPYLVYQNRVIIIDKDGRDIGLRMYGNLEWVSEDILKGLDINGNPLYWDKTYNIYYHEEPAFESIGGVEMTRLKAGYVLRKYPKLIKPIRKQDIYYNQKIVWMKDWLIIKDGTAGDEDYSAQRILSYGFNFFYTKTEWVDLPSVTMIDRFGNLVGRRWTVPDDDVHRTPVWRQTTLTNAYTGKEGFPDK